MTTTHNNKSLYPQKIYWNPTYEDRELNLEIYFTRVTPEKARQLMRTMDKNRPMRPTQLKKLRESLVMGKWFPNGDVIRLDKFGKLIDGQHRLTTIGEGVETFDLLTIRGFDSNDIDHLDQNSARTFSDNQKLKGRPNAKQLSEGINFLWRLSQNNLKAESPAGFRQQDLDAAFGSTGVLDNDVVYSIQQTKDPKGNYHSKPITGLRFLLSEHYGRQKTEVFFDRFIYGKDNAHLDKHNPANMLAKKIMSYGNGKPTDITERFKKGVRGDNWVSLYLFEAFQAYLEDKPLKRWVLDKAPILTVEHSYWRKLCSMAKATIAKHEDKYISSLYDTGGKTNG
tara:strand:+ start:2305 stop:3321 length:1017 start_codon:yes stop_codon:yes gene_type:complete